MAISKHPVITRFMQGIYNSRPPQWRYKFVWDVRILVRHIEAMPLSEKLPLKELSWKQVTLLVITNADRALDQKFAGFEFQGFFTSEGVHFEVAGLSKTRQSGPPREVVYGRFASSPSICPVSTLHEYEKTVNHISWCHLPQLPAGLKACSQQLELILLSLKPTQRELQVRQQQESWRFQQLIY